jgi:hypothetical protein
MNSSAQRRALAERLRRLLDEKPTATIDELAAEVGAKPVDVEFILDNYNGETLEFRGAGQGGGWVK